MRDNLTNPIEDEFSEAALHLLLDEYASASGETLLARYETAAPLENPILDRKCRGQIRRYFRRKGIHRAIQRGAKAAAVLLVCLGLCLPLALSVEAIRVPVLNFCLVRYPRFLQIIASPKTPSEETRLFDALKAEQKAFAPDGYSVFQSDASAVSFFALYRSDAWETASISVYGNDGSLRVDSENCTQSELEINGMEAIHLKKKGTPEQSLLLFVTRQGVVCHLYASNLSEEAFLEFVYSFAGFFSV